MGQAARTEKHFDTRERFERFFGDALIREAGFRIHARPAKGEAVWERRGKVLVESEVVRIVEEEARP